MRRVFADTAYWVALANPRDPLRDVAVAASKAISDKAKIVTTDSVIIELFNFFCTLGSENRSYAVHQSRIIHRSPNVEVLPQNRSVLKQAVSLYEDRPDKGYSLTDCISMVEMRARDITEVLASDHHFEQEGFIILLK
jgi:predicted nucleic acid-binding protein